jgi:hypothetical protein
MALAITLVTLAVAAASASAATTRAEWVAQVDPICQNGLAQEAAVAQPIAAAVKYSKKHPRSRKADKRLLRATAAFFRQAAAIDHAVDAQIATVPPAADDVSLVAVWLRARGELTDLEVRFFTSITHPGKSFKAFSRLFNQLFELSAREFEVADLVRDFGFQYCTQPGSEQLFIF